MTSASTHSPARRWSAMLQPTISRVARSSIAARYSQPSSVGRWLMSASQTGSGRSATKWRAVVGAPPDGVGPLGDEGAVEQVGGDRQVVPAVGGPRRPPAAPPRLQAHLAHQPLDPPARVAPALPAQLGGDPPA